MSRSDLFRQPLSTTNVGIDFIREDIKKQGIPSHQVNWAPSTNGDPELLKLLDQLKNPTLYEKTQQANEEAVTRIIQSKSILVGFGKAINVMSDTTETTILHVGPPITYENMCGPTKGAAQGALIFGGLAKDLADTDRIVRSGAIMFSPCHEHNAADSVVGVTSLNMYVHIVKSEAHGNTTFANLDEQLIRVLRFGVNNQSVVDHLIWMRDVLGLLPRDAMTFCPEGIDLRLVSSQALRMGDECHNCNVVENTLLVQALTPYMVQIDFSHEQLKEVFEFPGSSDYFSDPTWMGAAKCALDTGHNVESSTIITTVCRNGVKFRVRASGIDGDHWFMGPAQRVIGSISAGYTQEDTGLDMGDSAIIETHGVSGFAMAATPTVVSLAGGTVAEALNCSKRMLEITTKKNPNVTIPVLGFMGVPTGTDVSKVLEAGMLPVISTAIVHREPGIGMIGAGLTNPPTNVSNEALKALVATIN